MTNISPKQLFFNALDVYKEAINGEQGFLADELVIEYLLDNDVDMADAHGLLAGIYCIDNYDLTVS